MIRVPDAALGEREQITLLEWVIECFWIYRTQPGLVEDKREEMEDRMRSMLESGEPPRYVPDLAVALHTLNPFPASVRVRERLEQRYGVATMTDENWLELLRGQHASLWLQDLNRTLDEDEDQRQPDFDQVFEDAMHPARRDDTYRLGVYRPKPPGFAYVAEVPVRWNAQNLFSQLLAADRIGSWMWAVDVALAEYFALTDIERWAARTLVRQDR